MNGTRPPLTSTNASARVAVKRAKAGSAFTLDNSDFSLHLLVWFYIAARNSGTTAPKISVFSRVLKGKKFSILKAFHGATAFCGANANTISYNITFVNLRVRAYLPSRHSKPFSERKLISFRKANCRKKSLQKYNKHALRSDGEKDQNKGGTLLQPVSVIAGRPPRGTSIHHDIKQFCGLLRRHGAQPGRDHLCQCGPQQDQWT